MDDKARERSPLRFCALAYMAQGDRFPQDDTKVIAIVTSSQEDVVAIRVHPEWEKIVDPRDREYVKSLYRDFRERVKRDPGALFQQLSALAVGPMVACGSGANLAEHPAYFALMDRFKEL